MLGLMWVLPFLYSDHPLPAPAFYSEWIAVVLGVVAMFFLGRRDISKSLVLPRIVLLPLALALIAMFQYVLGYAVYQERVVLFVLYLLWSALLMVLARNLRDELGLQTVTTVLAGFVLAGAELSALIGLMQHYSWGAVFGDLVMKKNSAVIAGNIAQPNHLANYLTLGLVSLGLLHNRWKLYWWKTTTLAVPLLFVLVLTGSRSPWLFMLGITAIAYLWQRSDKAKIHLLKYCMAVLIGFAAMHYVAQFPWLAGTHGNVTAAHRMAEEVGAPQVGEAVKAAATQGSIRLSIWREAWLIFKQNPILGAGFDQYPWQHFLLGPVLRDGTMTQLNDYVEHAHNLIFHFAAVMGLTGLLALLVPLTRWVKQFYRASRSEYHWWGGAMLGILLIHSMLEYPLWYTFFLGVASVVLGMLDDTSYQLERAVKKGWIAQLVILTVLLSGLLVLSQTLMDYRKLIHLHEARSSRVLLVGSDQYFQIRNELIGMQAGNTLLKPYVETLLAGTGWDHLSDGRALNGRVMHNAPASEAVFREVWLLMREGRQAEARIQLERVIWTYPRDFPGFAKQLENLARMDSDPERYPALLNFARQIYADWRHANLS